MLLYLRRGGESIRHRVNKIRGFFEVFILPHVFPHTDRLFCTWKLLFLAFFARFRSRFSNFVVYFAPKMEQQLIKGRKKATPGYNSWAGMLQRCYDPAHISYKYYGARGIQVCDEWRSSFEAFFRDLGPRPSPRHSLERPNGGDYTPENTIWGTWDMQVASRADPDRIALSQAGKRSAAVKKARKREAIEQAGQLSLLT